MNRPLRIISLLSSATEILYGIGAGGSLVAVSHECDWPPDATAKLRATSSRVDSQRSSLAIDNQVKQLLHEGGPLYEIDRELIVSLSPQVIVTQSKCDVCSVKYEDVLDLVEQNESLSDTQVIALNPHSLDDIFEDILTIGRVIDHSQQAERYAASLRRRVKHVAAKTAGLKAEQRPTVACIEWLEPIMLAGNWTPELIELAGGRSELVEPGSKSEYLSWETLRQHDPDVVIAAPCGFDLGRTLQEAASLFQLPGFRQLKAVREKRIWALDGNAYLNRSGPRMVDSLEILAHLLHPKLFSEALTKEASASGALTAWRLLTEAD